MININIQEKKYNKNTILEKINVELKEGEFLSIIGPSGCGNTTLLNIIASLDKDFIGQLKGDFSNISFMFQDHRLLPWLTIKENLLLVSKDKNLQEIENLIKSRNEAKANKDYARADAIRNELLSVGVSIKDTREGTQFELI